MPELVAGLVVGYLALMLVLSIRDPRYTLPLVVYVAVIATGWIAVTRRAVLAAISGEAAAAVVVNVAGAVTDDVPTAQISILGDSPAEEIQPGRFTFMDGRKYVVGPPRPDPFWDWMLTAAEREGVETARILGARDAALGHRRDRLRRARARARDPRKFVVRRGDQPAGPGGSTHGGRATSTSSTSSGS